MAYGIEELDDNRTTAKPRALRGASAQGLRPFPQTSPGPMN